MTQSDARPAVVPSGNGRLNGWKEIAAYLGKSVRTAQRWEVELSLPIHRIRSAGGEIIYAYCREIDTWLVRCDTASRGLSGIETTDEPALDGSDRPIHAASVDVSPASVGRTWRIALLSVATTLFLLVSLLWISGAIPFRLFANPPAQPASWKVEGGLLKVFDSNGNHVWDHNFGRTLLDETYALAGGGFPPEKSAFITDLDGNGTQEVGIVVRAESGPQAPFQVLNHDRSLRFATRPEHSVRFGDTSYAPPWPAVHLLVTPEPDGSKSVWVAYIHNLWFPSLLQKLDPRGEVLAEYWSNGHITSLHEGVFQGRRAMLVGATNNDHHAATLAVLDYANPSGFAPAARPKYLCTDCPTGTPLAFFVFPATELSRVTGFRPLVQDIRTDGSGNFILNVDQTPHDPALGGQGAAAFYVLSPAGSVVEAETGDSHRLLHSRLETRNRLDHPFGLACEKQLFPVLRWDRANQRFVPEQGKLANPPR